MPRKLPCEAAAFLRHADPRLPGGLLRCMISGAGNPQSRPDLRPGPRCSPFTGHRAERVFTTKRRGSGFTPPKIKRRRPPGLFRHASTRALAVLSVRTGKGPGPSDLGRFQRTTRKGSAFPGASAPQFSKGDADGHSTIQKGQTFGRPGQGERADSLDAPAQRSYRQAAPPQAPGRIRAARPLVAPRPLSL